MERETLSCCDLCGSERIEVLDKENCICGCRDCAYVFDNPRPTAEAIRAFYSRPTQYDSWINEENARGRLWKRRLRKMRRTAKVGSLLDVGAGIGQFLHRAQGYYSTVCGTEISRSAIDIAKKKYSLSLLEGSLTSVEFEGARFDNITLFHVLEHVPSPRALVERCHSLLRDRGILVIAVPNDLLAIRDRLRRALRSIRSGRKVQRIGRLGLPRIVLDGSLAEIHLSHFTTQVLERLLQSCGFSVLERGLDPYYVATGRRTIQEFIYYGICLLLKLVLRRNVYDTIWMAAKKTAPKAGTFHA